MMRHVLIGLMVLGLAASGRAQAEDAAQAATPPPSNSVKLSHNDLLELRNLRLEQEVLSKQLENMQLQGQQVQKAMQDRAGKIDAMARDLVAKKDRVQPDSVDVDYDKGTITYTLPKKEQKP